tara:strand:- start:1656 stop:2036 length:381 start_codon:yes stop_codon:yes gene_type:complete
MDAFEAIDVYSDAEWSRIMSVNLTVPTRMIRAVIPFMKAKKNGSIINVASKAAVSGAAAGLAYTTSKHGLLGVTKHTAWRFRDEGIRCNAVLPGSKLLFFVLLAAKSYLLPLNSDALIRRILTRLI